MFVTIVGSNPKIARLISEGVCGISDWPTSWFMCVRLGAP